MGFREWVFKVESTADILKVMKIIKEHNSFEGDDDNHGDPLYVCNFIRCKNPKYPTCYYLAVCNSGGEAGVWNFLEGKYPVGKITGPWDEIPHNKTNKCKLLWPKKDENNDFIISPFDNKNIRVPKDDFDYDI